MTETVRVIFGVTAALTLVVSAAVTLSSIQYLGSSDGWTRIVGGVQLGLATFALVMAITAAMGIVRFARGVWWRVAAFYAGGVLAIFLLFLVLAEAPAISVVFAVGAVVWGFATTALFVTTRSARIGDS